MRAATFIVALPCLLLAACGSSSPATSPSPTKPPAYADRLLGISVRVGRVLSGPTASYLLVSLVNSGKHDFHADASVQFLDSALVEPTTQGTVGACDADTSRGVALQYDAIPAGHTSRGWIRCDYPRGSHVVAVFWHAHEIGAYRVPS